MIGKETARRKGGVRVRSIAGLLAGLALCSVGPALAQGDGTAVPRLEAVPCPEPAPAADRHCLVLSVPQLRRPEEGQLTASPPITVFVSILASTAADPEPDPVVIVPGGPGAIFNPPVRYLLDGLAEIRRRRAVIVIDQRGVGASRPRLACEEYRGRWRAGEVCVALLRERGIEPGAFNSDETAQDLRDLRRALGLARWNAVGASYGSRVVQRLAEIDPDGTRSAVLLASLPLAPSLARPDRWAQRRAALDRLFADCAADPACAAAHGDLRQKLAAIEAALAAAREPPPGQEAAWDELRRVDRRHGGFAAALTARLDWAEELPRLPAAIAALHDFVSGTRILAAGAIAALYAGDGSATASAGRLPPIDDGMIGSVIRCAEDFLPERGETPRTGFCRHFAPLALGRNPARQDHPPTLVVTGAYDVRTPTAWSDEIAARIPGAVLVRFGDVGHGVSYRHPCANAIVAAFIANPRAALDRSCLAAHQRPKFATPALR
jgi:pimeloyl-ACP methyl ester carboxylesterase